MVDVATLTTKDVANGLSLSVRVSRSFTIRARLACWLIGLAGRVIDVPCKVDLHDQGAIAPGDVVHDLWDARSKSRPAKVMTVNSVDEDGMATCVWFDGDAVHRRVYQARSLRKIEA
ncbi:hypothetical protein A6J80_17375 [Paracoccus yeei]|uniref:Uncharacterized protein n=1 Tax=Paracoccus yeei TaxID=147645 RepID=A0A1V0GVH0_9RHOB|nr:hypothetical protein [Paracoccus yeei]ARC37885.1 hypothetical protein A6J80_17375 [Paracoccus yeei]